MTNRVRSFVIAGIHLALVASLTAKLLIDRRTLPHGWAEAVAYDPELPIRGRYVRLNLLVPPVNSAARDSMSANYFARLVVVDDRVRSTFSRVNVDQAVFRRSIRGDSVEVLSEPVAFFIPEHVKDPSIRPAGEHLWVDVTIPERGPPRPIRLGVQRGEGPIEPLTLQER